MSDGILRAACGVKVNRVLELGNRVVGSEGDASGEVLFGCNPVPPIDGLDTAERGVCFAVLGSSWMARWAAARALGMSSSGFPMPKVVAASRAEA